ncbi:MAG: OmpA family protein [Bacteroidota bacterium]
MMNESPLIYIVLFLWAFAGQGQSDNASENLGDCAGAVQYQLNTTMEAEFTGKAGFLNDTKRYDSILDLSPHNTFWIAAHPPASGALTFEFSSLPHPAEIAIFRSKTKNGCQAIHEHGAELISSLKNTTENAPSIELNVSSKYHYFIYINTSEDRKAAFSLSSDFLPVKKQSEREALENEVDLREESGSDAFTVRVVDKTTRLPVDAAIMIENSKSFNALYNANVLIFPDSKYLSFHIQINAEGYMFKDTLIDRRTTPSNTVTIGLNTFKSNDQIELEGIQFKSESHELLESSKSAIRKLRDFLAVNRTIQIELIGHVYKKGRNTIRARHFSKKRAKRVKSYLVQNGIQEDRISVAGRGNSEMIYPDPSSEAEIQANRRVEIKIR